MPVIINHAAVGDAVTHGSSLIANSIKGMNVIAAALVASFASMAQVGPAVVTLMLLLSVNVLVVTIFAIIFAKRSGYINGHQIGELAGYHTAANRYDLDLQHEKQVGYTLTGHIYKLTQHITGLTSNRDILLQQYEGICAEFNNLTKAKDDLSAMNVKISHDNDVLTEKFDNLTAEHNYLSAANLRIETELNNKLAKLEKLTETRDDLLIANSTLLHDVNDATARADKSDNAVAKAKAELADFNAANAKLRVENENLVMDNKMLAKENAYAQKTVTMLEEREEQLLESIAASESGRRV